MAFHLGNNGNHWGNIMGSIIPDTGNQNDRVPVISSIEGLMKSESLTYEWAIKLVSMQFVDEKKYCWRGSQLTPEGSVMEGQEPTTDPL